MSTRRWPARNTDSLVRRVTKSLPEVSRRAAMGVLNVSMHVILESLEQQARDGAEHPHVKIRGAGVFELRHYRSATRHKLNGGVSVTPARWRLVFRPSLAWRTRLNKLTTRTISEGVSG